MSDIIQPIAFNLHPDLIARPLTLYGLAFPEAWRGPFTRLEEQRSNRGSDRASFPITKLNAVLTALIPHLLTVPGQAYAPRQDLLVQEEAKPWLIARTPDDSGISVPPAKILHIVRAWLEVYYRECSLYEEVRSQLHPNDLQWTPLSESFIRAPLSNGTVDIDGLAFTALPALLADRLQERDVAIPVYGQLRHLHRVPTDKGAELMTWPPTRYTSEDGKRWFFSYVVRLSLQTLVGCPKPRVHVSYGVRRWVSSPMIDGDTIRLGNRARSVYLQTTEPWKGVAPSGAFTQASIYKPRGHKPRVLDWRDQVPAIAQRANVVLPTAMELGHDPVKWLTGNEPVVAAIVEQTPRAFEVGVGIGPEERELFTSIIKEALAEELDLCPPLTSVKEIRKSTEHSLIKDLRDVPSEQRRAALGQSVAKQVTIEILYETPAVRDMLADRIQALLCRPRPPLVDSTEISPSGKKRPRKRAEEPPPLEAPEEQEIALGDDGRLRIITRPLGEIGGLLQFEESSDDQRAYGTAKRKATEARIGEIERAFDMADEPTLTIVELPNYQDPRKPGMRRIHGPHDPKRALRVGLARRHRVSKFLTNELKNLLERCENSVRDGLRQLGYLPAPIGYSALGGRSLPTNLTAAGVWIIRLNKQRAHQAMQVPVVVLLHTAENIVQAWLPDGKGTRPYHEALIDLTRLNPQLLKYAQDQQWNKKEQNRRIRVALSLFLTQELPREGVSDVVILAEAQNIRQPWDGLQNPFVPLDELLFGRDEHPMSLDSLPTQMRLIRLRTYNGDETPQWYTPGAQPGRDYHQGVWLEPAAPRFFYNIGAKPNTQSAAKSGKQQDPTEQIAMPSMLEIQVLIQQEGDNPEAWSLAVDQWRRMGFLTNEMTLRPLPVDWARHMDRYAEVIGPWVDDQQWGDDDDDDYEAMVQLELF